MYNRLRTLRPVHPYYHIWTDPK